MKKFKDFLSEKGISDEDFAKKTVEEMAQLQSEYNAVLQKEYEMKLEENAKAVTNAQTAAETAKTEAANSKTEAEAAKTAVTELKTATDKIPVLEEALKKQGEELQKRRNSRTAENIFKSFTEESYKEKEKDKNARGDKGEMFKFETKAFDSANVMSVEEVSPTVYPENGTPGLNTTLRMVYARVVGFFRPVKPVSRVMDLVSLNPLDAETLVVFNENIVGDVEITPECVEKPVVTMNYTEQQVSAEPIAAIWYTTLKIRRFFAAILNKFRQRVEELIDEKIPTAVLQYIQANASPFTPAAGIDVFVDPNDFDAIAAVAASLRKFGYAPNAVVMDSISYTKMITDKGEDGHYRLSNGGSIALINGVLKLGSVDLVVVEDPTMPTGSFLVGDLRSSVYVGLDGTVYYFETDGRTDNVQGDPGEAPKTGLAVNIRTHEVAQFVAVLIPDAVKSGLVYTTFDEVKELITAEEPS